jgi:hypothetical protein
MIGSNCSREDGIGGGMASLGTGSSDARWAKHWTERRQKGRLDAVARNPTGLARPETSGPLHLEPQQSR